jgi:hypothetical protein
MLDNRSKWSKSKRNQLLCNFGYEDRRVKVPKHGLITQPVHASCPEAAHGGAHDHRTVVPVNLLIFHDRCVDRRPGRNTY